MDANPLSMMDKPRSSSSSEITNGIMSRMTFPRLPQDKIINPFSAQKATSFLASSAAQTKGKTAIGHSKPRNRPCPTLLSAALDRLDASHWTVSDLSNPYVTDQLSADRLIGCMPLDTTLHLYKDAMCSMRSCAASSIDFGCHQR